MDHPKMAPESPENGTEGTMPALYMLQKQRVPKVFHGSIFEDVEDWLAHFKQVTDFSGWTGANKLRSVLQIGGWCSCVVRGLQGLLFIVGRVTPVLIAMNELSGPFCHASIHPTKVSCCTSRT